MRCVPAGSGARRRAGAGGQGRGHEAREPGWVLPAARRQQCVCACCRRLSRVTGTPPLEHRRAGDAARRRRGGEEGEAAGERLGCGAGAMEAAAKGAFVLGNLAEVVERVLGFLPTKALLRAAW